MSHAIPERPGVTRALVAAIAAAMVVGCTSIPKVSDGAAEARARLTTLQSDPHLAARAPVAMKAAEAAVRTAEQPQADKVLDAHNAYIAKAKVDTAWARAEMRFAEAERVTLTAEREAARLAARTREADAERNNALLAEGKVDVAEGKVDAAEAKVAAAQAANAALQQQIADMQAKVTERGVEMILGDVLFATDRSDLMAAASGNLDKLASFLQEHGNRSVAIEGFTDSVGTDGYNRLLSQRRADSVKVYLMEQGVDGRRLTAIGKGEREPLESNETADGRQQNRRVAVIISNPPVATR